MGTVQLALHVGAGGFERLVVVKRMHDHVAKDAVVARRFVHEARLAGIVHHANVLGIQDVGQDDEGLFLVLDFVEGDSFRGLLDRAAVRGERLPPRIVMRVVLDGLAGLDAVHDATGHDGRPLGLLHRDVSPDNLLVGRDGVTRLCDFGMARHDECTKLTEPGMVVGKSLYIAPEYAELKSVDRRLDVYAMGVTLWVALAGRDPWEDLDDFDTLVRAMTDGLPPLSSVLPEVPPDIEAVVKRAMAIDPAERFPSAGALSTALFAAARSSFGVANAGDVADVVERLAGGDIAARRIRIADRVTLPPPIPSAESDVIASSPDLGPAVRPRPGGTTLPSIDSSSAEGAPARAPSRPPGAKRASNPPGPPVSGPPRPRLSRPPGRRRGSQTTTVLGVAAVIAALTIASLVWRARGGTAEASAAPLDEGTDPTLVANDVPGTVVPAVLPVRAAAPISPEEKGDPPDARPGSPPAKVNDARAVRVGAPVPVGAPPVGAPPREAPPRDAPGRRSTMDSPSAPDQMKGENPYK
jgi:eukaryotic-like serine/threonine-protein kinase